VLGSFTLVHAAVEGAELTSLLNVLFLEISTIGILGAYFNRFFIDSIFFKDFLSFYFY
jgi:hypothetical protein